LYFYKFKIAAYGQLFIQHRKGLLRTSIQTGNETVTGNIVVLGFELNQLNQAANAAGFQYITEVPQESIRIFPEFYCLSKYCELSIIIRHYMQ